MTTHTANLDSSADWHDAKRYLWLLSPLIPVLGFLTISLFYLTEITLFAWGGPILVYGLIPLLDRLIGADTSNPPESAVANLENDAYYRIIVYAYIPTQLLMTILAVWVAMNREMGSFALLGLIMTTGTINGIAINTAHELGHKKESFDRWMAKLTLAPVAYGHFFVEHNRGHHKNVATPNDPASSKMGESFWRFLPRTMIGSVQSAWSIEKDRLARTGRSVWSLDNDNLQAWSLSVILFGGLSLWLGANALPFLMAQALFGAMLLEVINYIEHYGLLRQTLPNGRVERCAPRHSWNSNHIVTNLFLYQLQRHSDHHANPTRRFQALRHFEESPQLPSGYASMLIPAYIPWLWFRMMDPLVAQHHQGDLSKANMYPPKRDTLMARWHSDEFTAQAAPTQFVESAPSGPVFATADRYQCTDCGYIYAEQTGCPQEGFPAGTRWNEIPDDWPCPDCAVREKLDFKPVSDAL
ncbi:MAG: fatty acid desaturase [Oceanococcus sp.]